MDTVQSADGTVIAFDRSGAGPALVLVVGAFCDRSSTKTLAARLGSAFTVYQYDRRGRGDSGEASPYSVEREVDDLAAVIGAAGGPAFAFGHYSGGALVLEAAASGVPIRRLAVYEPPHTEGPSYEFAGQLEQMAADGRDSDATTGMPRWTGWPRSRPPPWPWRAARARRGPKRWLTRSRQRSPAARLVCSKGRTMARPMT